MKQYFFLLFAAAQSIACIAQTSANDQPYLTKSLAATPIKTAEVQTSGGGISVTGVNNNDARVEVYIRDNHGKTLSKEEIAEKLDKYNLTVDVTGSTLHAIAKSKMSNMDWKKSLNISFKIYAPNNVSTDLSTSGGNIQLTDLDGNQKFRTSGGNLVLENISGDINGGTSGGNISVSHSHENINLSTSGGNIDAADCNGKMSLSTSGGNIKLNNLQGNIKANTSGGSIRGNSVKGALSAHTSGGNVSLDNLSCSLETSTSGGNMSVQLVELGDYVKLNNSGGTISLELPKNKGLDLYMEGNKINTTSLTNFSGSVKDDKIDGKMNGGGTSVMVRTSGKVNFSLQ